LKSNEDGNCPNDQMIKSEINTLEETWRELNYEFIFFFEIFFVNLKEHYGSEELREDLKDKPELKNIQRMMRGSLEGSRSSLDNNSPEGSVKRGELSHEKTEGNIFPFI
jgi:hypothetical protein